MGNWLSRKFDPDTDIPDLTGKVVLVTGGNSGIGCAVIEKLVRHGAKVYMGARSEQRAKAATERIHAAAAELEPGRGEVVWLPLDLSDPRSVVAAAEDFMQKEERLDILINNAAVLLVPYAKDHDNIQNIVMVNYIGTYLFTRALLPLLKRTAQEPNSDVRIVVVNSHSHKFCPSDLRFRNLDDLNREFADTMFPQFLRYALSKTMQLMFAGELQRRLDDTGSPIMCMAADPGEVQTEGVQAYTDSVGPLLGPLYRLVALLTFQTPAQGARCPLFCAASPEPRAEPIAYRGAYLSNGGRRARLSGVAQKRELWAELWETTERVLGDVGVDVPAV
ncbi:NAD-P-binding protein [Daedaleopsis nitida]|nr:NAD-P-binding protein [Daedaleopsis nitida]